MTFETPPGDHRSRADLDRTITILQQEMDRLEDERRQLNDVRPRMKELGEGILRILRSSALPATAFTLFEASKDMKDGWFFGDLSAGVAVLCVVGSSAFLRDIGVGIKQIIGAMKGEKPYQLNAEEKQMTSLS
jgi:hypothetical protein